MYVPTGLKTVDGKDIMGFNGAFYLQNKEKINKMLKKYADIIIEEDEEEKQRENKYILKENTEKYSINKKHDKMFKEILSDKKETVEFINSFLHLNLIMKFFLYFLQFYYQHMLLKSKVDLLI